MSTVQPLCDRALLSSRMYTFMPPVSFPPRAARGQLWTLSMAMRLICLLSAVAAGQGINVMVTAAETVLVCLVSPQELEAPHPALDGVFDAHGYRHDAGAQM